MSIVAARTDIPPPLPLPPQGTEVRSVVPVGERQPEARPDRSQGRRRALPSRFIDAGLREREIGERRLRGASLSIAPSQADEARARPGRFPASTPFLAQQLAQLEDDAPGAEARGREAGLRAYHQALGRGVDVIGPAGQVGLVV